MTLFTRLPDCFPRRFQRSTSREELEMLGYRAFSMGSMAKHITSVKVRSARELHNWEIAPQTRGKTRSKREGNSEIMLMRAAGGADVRFEQQCKVSTRCQVEC